LERQPQLHDLERLTGVARDRHLLRVAPEARGEPAAHRLDLGLEHLPHRVHGRGVRVLEVAPHRLLYDPRRWAHAPVVEIDQRAVERERLLDPEPEVLVSSDVRGQAPVHSVRQAAEAVEPGDPILTHQTEQGACGHPTQRHRRAMNPTTPANTTNRVWVSTTRSASTR